MALRVYSVRELVDAGKVKLRSLLSGVGTEDGSDFGLIMEVAARLIQGVQVAGAYILEQCIPETADAQSLERMQQLRAITLAKGATKARGLIMFKGPDGSELPAGTVVTFPAANSFDGTERSYVLLDDVELGSASPWSGNATITPSGSTDWRLRLSAVARDEIAVDQVVGFSPSYAPDTAIRRWDRAAGVAELYLSPVTCLPWATSPTLSCVATSGRVVRAECTVAGKAGNSGPSVQVTLDGSIVATILQMGGGWDAEEILDPDDARVVRLLEDELAGGASLGNPQQLRELALSCPDVALDDAIVYRGARGPATVDIVAIGRSQRLVVTEQPDMRVEFRYGVQGRQIGDVQAQRIQDYLLGTGPYSERLVSEFDDVRVHQLDYDFSGQNESTDAYADGTNWARSSTDLTITLSEQPGYGPDSGIAATYTPGTSSLDKLYPPSGTLAEGIKVGDRVWVKLGEPTSNNTRRAYFTAVATVLAIAQDRTYATITSQLGQILEWGTAGPLTQPVLTAVFDYFDELGPGSYLRAPKGVAYLRNFVASGVDIAPEPGVLFDRWPSEGRRWRSGYRSAELTQRILAVEGVRSVSIPFAEFDPLPMCKLWLRGATVAYA